MKSNVGNIDRAIRIVVAVIIGILYFTNQINGTAAIILGIIAIAFLVTGFVRFCPGYLPFNFSTKKKSEVPPAE